MSQFYGGGKLTKEYAKALARACAPATGGVMSDDESEDDDELEQWTAQYLSPGLVKKWPIFSPPVPSSTSSSFLSSPPSPIFTSTSSITSTTFSSTTTRLSFLQPSTLVSPSVPVPASVPVLATVPVPVSVPVLVADSAPESVQVLPGNQCKKKTLQACAMKQPGEICEEPLCDQMHVWGEIFTDGYFERTRLRQGPPSAAAPVPSSAAALVPESREEDMPVKRTSFPEEVTLQVDDLSELSTLLPELCNTPQSEGQMLEPRQICDEDVYSTMSRTLCEHGGDLECYKCAPISTDSTSSMQDVYESRTRILCEHGVDQECYECITSSSMDISVSNLAREVDRIAQRYPRIPPCPFPYVDWQALSRPSWKDRVGLPKPVELPILSCSPDPALSMPPKPNMGIVDPWERPSYPFGTKLGYLTTMGPVAMPTVSVNGYSWCKEENAWRISASPPSRRRRGGRRGGQGRHLRRGG